MVGECGHCLCVKIEGNREFVKLKVGDRGGGRRTAG